MMGTAPVSADPVSAGMGAEVSLTATPNSGYHFKKWEVVPGDVEIEDNKFTMPAAHVTVKAIFERECKQRRQRRRWRRHDLLHADL